MCSQHSRRYATGFCVGALAAAAVSSSYSQHELITASLDAVKVSLRVGLRVGRAASALADIDPCTKPSPWSYVVPYTKSADSLLKAYLSKLNVQQVT